jgi:hypothetical protein
MPRIINNPPKMIKIKGEALRNLLRNEMEMLLAK